VVVHLVLSVRLQSVQIGERHKVLQSTFLHEVRLVLIRNVLLLGVVEDLQSEAHVQLSELEAE
jgi:hypothetical protein